MEPLKIGNITLPHRAVFGPMAGFTDAPCRRLMAQHGAGFTVSEMVSSRALVYGDHKTVSLLKAKPNGAPYGVQIFGEVPEIMGEATAAIEGLPAPKEPNLQARMNALRRQVEEMVEQKGEFVAMPQARAQTMHYMKGLKGAAALRRYCCTLTHLEDLDDLIAAVFEEQRKAGLDPDDVREVPFP